MNLCRVVFYVLPLNRFTVEEAEASISNVTAEGGKKTAQASRETPFWRIKSVKWLWESGQRSWMCPPGWGALRKTPWFLSPILNLFLSFVFAFLVNLWTVARFHFQSQFCLSSQLFSSPFFFYRYIYIYFGQITFSSFCSLFDFHLFLFPLNHSSAGRHTLDQDIRLPLDPTV